MRTRLYESLFRFDLSSLRMPICSADTLYGEGGNDTLDPGFGADAVYYW